MMPGLLAWCFSSHLDDRLFHRSVFRFNTAMPREEECCCLVDEPT